MSIIISILLAIAYPTEASIPKRMPPIARKIKIRTFKKSRNSCPGWIKQPKVYTKEFCV